MSCHSIHIPFYLSLVFKYFLRLHQVGLWAFMNNIFKLIKTLTGSFEHKNMHWSKPFHCSSGCLVWAFGLLEGELLASLLQSLNWFSSSIAMYLAPSIFPSTMIYFPDPVGEEKSFLEYDAVTMCHCVNTNAQGAFFHTLWSTCMERV